MTRWIAVFALFSVLAGPLAMGQQANEAEVALKAAQQKALVDGDLNAAIEQYKQIVARHGANRAVAARALVVMGRAYEKLGNAEARNAYDRVAREFGDQTEAAAEARTRLTALRRPTVGSGSMATRLVWTLATADIFGNVSPDGRYIPYVDWDRKGDLYLHDLTTGSDRRLTDTANSGQFAEEFSFSLDGKQLVYSWFRGDTERWELRVVSLQGSGVPAFRRLFDNEDIEWIGPYDWSADGKWIAVSVTRKDRTTQIGLVSARDGSLTVLKSVDWRGTSKMFFSPDSRYLAYDLPVTDTSERRDVFVMAVDGSRDVRAASHPSGNAVMGWSPDGMRLLFASDRGGSTGLWSVRFADGKFAGSPELIKADLGQGRSMGVTGAGVLYSTVGSLNRDVQLASVDFTTGRFLSAPVPAVHTFVGSNELPDWSPDGKHLAYLSHRGSPGSHYIVVGIRSVQTGDVRELSLSPGFRYATSPPRWAADSRSLFLSGRDAKGRLGIFRIDAESGQTSIVVARESSLSLPGSPVNSPDGKSLYYSYRLADSGTPWPVAFFKRDLVSGDERELIRRATLGAVNLSPDGRYIATGSKDPSTGSNTMILIPTTGGESRELMRAEAGHGLGVKMWAPDSRSFFIIRGRIERPGLLAENTVEILRVSLDGSAAKVDLDLKSGGQVRVHPDGSQVVFQVNSAPKPTEVWVLENFLPSPSASK